MANENLLQDAVNYLSDSFRRHLKLWLIPTIVVGMLGTTYAFVKSAKWMASQAFHIRDEIKGSQNGRFDNNDERKLAQESIIELARSRAVVSAALKEIGPPGNFISLGAWPTSSAVASTQDVVSVSVPKGAELGATEVVRLDVVDKSTERAIELNQAILKSTIARLQRLRAAKAQSVISELNQKLAVAESHLELATKRLKEMETKIGSDLGELRTLESLGTGESNLRTALTQIKNDIRLTQKKQTENKELQRLLIESESNSDRLIATPSSLLSSLSGLQQLRDGLVVAQLKLADLSGKMSPRHPGMKSAAEAVRAVRHQIRLEIPSAISAVKAELKVNEALMTSLQKELAEVQDSLNQLAVLRAPYSNLVKQVAAYAEQKRFAEEVLDSASANQETSNLSSLITPIGEVEVSDSPIGPGRLTIAAVSWIGGFMIGAGLVFLASPIRIMESDVSVFVGRRVSEHSSQPVQFGRRISDQATTEFLVNQGHLELADRNS